MLAPREFVSRMQPGDRHDPLLLQILPTGSEHQEVPGFTSDPVGDQNSQPVRGVLHKYAGRALLVTTGACAIHCRYCFRQEFPYASNHAGSNRWNTAIEYIRSHTDVHEVILSGGDPLMLSSKRLADLTEQLTEIGHVRRLRVHTRLPIVLPSRVNDNLCRWISSLPWPVVIVVHANHANEFDDQVDKAMARLRDAGAWLFNQSVLLKGVNDRPDALIELMERSFSAHVVPYYLHMLDRVRGTARFDCDRQHALALHEAMRVQLPGYLVPRLVREQAGAPYKLPVL
jgi:L-lysine 2,3-aminomutase